MNTQLPSEQPSNESRDNLQEYKADKNFIHPAKRKAMESMPPEKAYKNAASTFYMIAVLSFLNSLIAAFGTGFVFVIGLGITQLVDAIVYAIGKSAGDSKTTFIVVGLIFDLAVCVTIAIFGYFTSKGRMWAFTLGMILYALDTLLILLFKDWIGFAFHLFFLWQLWTTHSILRSWIKLKSQASDTFPQNIGTS